MYNDNQGILAGKLKVKIKATNLRGEGSTGVKFKEEGSNPIWTS